MVCEPALFCELVGIGYDGHALSMTEKTPAEGVVREALARLFLATGDEAPGALRDEDRKKVVEVTALLAELAPLVGSRRRGETGVLVDAAAGKSALGLLAAELLLAGAPRPWRLLAMERDEARAAAFVEAASRRTISQEAVEVALVRSDLRDAEWPEKPDVVVALHACGVASDAVLEGAVAAEARWLLLVPCCYGAAPGGRRAARGHEAQPPAQKLAAPWAETLGIPPRGEVGRRFAQSLIDAERTLRLEAAGYEVEVVPFVAPTVTPHNLLWRARRIGPSGRAEAAAERLCRLRSRG